MKWFIMFLLGLHVLPLFVFSWMTLLGTNDFSNLQWLVAWLMTAVVVAFAQPILQYAEKDNAKK